VADALNAAAAMQREPILALRVSTADERPRHQQVSHHSRAILDLALGPVEVAWPNGLDPPGWLEQYREVDVSGWRDACRGLPLSHMGRGPDDDPWFFAAAWAAGRLAAANL
jgi:hypothetical protein